MGSRIFQFLGENSRSFRGKEGKPLTSSLRWNTVNFSRTTKTTIRFAGQRFLWQLQRFDKLKCRWCKTKIYHARCSSEGAALHSWHNSELAVSPTQPTFQKRILQSNHPKQTKSWKKAGRIIGSSLCVWAFFAPSVHYLMRRRCSWSLIHTRSCNHD